MRRLCALSCFLLLCACATVSAQYVTLSDVLRQESVPFPPTSIPHVNALINSYATLNDSREFVIAYYIANPKDETLQPPLLITRYNKLTGEWLHTAVNASRVEELTRTKLWLGATTDFFREHDRYYLSLHWGPDAGCILILKTDFTVDDALLGWPQASFKSGALVYTKNIVHFADVHPETLWLYDPVTRDSKQLYPQPHDPLRDTFSARLGKVINNDRCRTRNWACDPQNFTTDIASVAVDDNTHSLAMHVRFEPEGFLDRSETKDSAEWEDDDYVYLYQLDPFRWRAFSIYDLKPKFGTDSLKELIAPENIEKVFVSRATN